MQGSSRTALAEVTQALLDRSAEAVRSGQAGDYTRVSDELFATVSLLAEQPTLRRAVSDPSLPPERRASVLASLLRDRVDRRTLELLQDAVRRRWSQPRDLVDAVEVLAVQAALTAAEGEGGLDDVEDELFRFGRIVDGEPALRGALTNPGLPEDRKRDLVRALLEGRASATTQWLVTYVVGHPRGRTLERLLGQFAQLAAQRRERLLARVTSAVPLDADQQSRLAGALRTVYGSAVQLQLEVDPELLGGLVVRVRDEIIDGSVLRRLDQARRRVAS